MTRNFGEAPRDGDVQAFKAERPRDPREQLSGLMRNISQRLNSEAQEQFGIEGLLDSECQVQMESFRGVHPDTLLTQSAAEVKKRELGFCGFNNPRIRAYHKEEYGDDSEEAMLERWRQSRETSTSHKMELAVTALLHKVLGDRFFVVRTAKFDDYNGVDNIIIDKKTGAVICAFDEVHEGGKGDRTKEKEDKIVDTAKGGGAELRFGLWIDGGKLKRSAVGDLPVFYLGLSTQELTELTQQMEYDLDKALSPQEELTYGKLIQSVAEQYKLLNKQRLPQGVKTRLNKFTNSLGVLKNYPASKKVAA